MSVDSIPGESYTLAAMFLAGFSLPYVWSGLKQGVEHWFDRSFNKRLSADRQLPYWRDTETRNDIDDIKRRVANIEPRDKQ